MNIQNIGINLANRLPANFNNFSSKPFGKVLSISIAMTSITLSPLIGIVVAIIIGTYQYALEKRTVETASKLDMKESFNRTEMRGFPFVKAQHTKVQGTSPEIPPGIRPEIQPSESPYDESDVLVNAEIQPADRADVDVKSTRSLAHKQVPPQSMSGQSGSEVPGAYMEDFENNTMDFSFVGDRKNVDEEYQDYDEKTYELSESEYMQNLAKQNEPSSGVIGEIDPQKTVGSELGAYDGDDFVSLV